MCFGGVAVNESTEFCGSTWRNLDEISTYLWQLYLRNNPGEFPFFTCREQRLSLSDISIERNTTPIVNAEGNTSTCFYVCIRVGNISGWRVDAHITLFKTYGRPPLQLLDEELSNELASLRDAFASTSMDCEFRNWVLLFTA